MSIWSWLGRKIRLTDGAFWAQFYGGSSWSGRSVSIDGAMKLSAWFAGARLNSETIATLPWGAYEKLANGQKRPRPDHELSELLAVSPNADQTPVEFLEGQIAPICIVGNSYAEKTMSGRRLVALQPIPFEECRPYRDSDGRLNYRFTDRGKRETLPEEKVFHIRGFGTGGDMGLSPVAYARNSLGAAMDIDEAAARVYGSGMRASGVFTGPDMDEAQRAQFYQNYVKPAEGSEAEGKSLVLPPGFTWHATNIPPKDAEMILSRKFTVEDICRWMGVPPILIGHSAEGQTMWGSGIEQIMLGWLMLGLRAYIKRIESAMNKRLVRPEERGRIYVECNIDGLVRADSQGRAALMSAFAQNGLRSRNELRALDNLPPKPGGDALTVQSNLVPLDQIGQPGGSNQVARDAVMAWLFGGDVRAIIDQRIEARAITHQRNPEGVQ